MPWIGYQRPPAEVPAHYQVPMLISERPEALDEARAKRRYWQQWHDDCIAHQKSCGRDNIDAAKWFKQESQAAMKELRGWKFVVDLLECYYDGKTQSDYLKAVAGMSEIIAPYAEKALRTVCDIANPYYGRFEDG